MNAAGGRPPWRETRSQAFPKKPDFFAGRLVKHTQVNALVIARYPCYHASVIQSFRDQGSEDIFNGLNSKAARRACPNSLWRVAARKLDQLDSVESLDELRLPPANHLEALVGARAGQYSIRINEQYRICCLWSANGPLEVEIVDFH
jgi:toxin HigB-1